MLRKELYEVIVDFEQAIKKKKSPKFKNIHRAEQVLRILKVDYYNFDENESKRCCTPKVRSLWEDGKWNAEHDG